MEVTVKMKWMYLACLLASATAWSGARACAQTDVAASIDGAFSGASLVGTQQATQSVGALLEVRHIFNPLLGFEAAYSYNRAYQMYADTVKNPPCPLSPNGGVVNCSIPPVVISAQTQAITGDWVVSRKMRSFRPFALAGAGVVFVAPSSGQAYTSYSVNGQNVNNSSYTNSTTEFLFVFGIGLDWELTSHFGLRLQDRANINQSPQLGGSGLTNNLTYTEEPALGICYRF